MSLVNVPEWIKKAFPQIIWDIPSSGRTVYLTFDDGPTPGVTPRVLDFLFQYNAKATFFCTGNKLEKFPEIASLIRNDNHTLANHGYNHLSGFRISGKSFAENARKGSVISNSKLFRPPYGHMTPWQYYSMGKEMKIVMWSAMSMDFSPKISSGQCLNNVMKSIYPGAIIVFHDSEKAAHTLLKTLPYILEKLDKSNYQIKAIPPQMA